MNILTHGDANYAEKDSSLATLKNSNSSIRVESQSNINANSQLEDDVDSSFNRIALQTPETHKMFFRAQRNKESLRQSDSGELKGCCKPNPPLKTDSAECHESTSRENSIPIQLQPNQSRKIIIHKTNPQERVLDEYQTNKIVHLQEEMITLRKELSAKESAWLKERTLLMNKIEIANYDSAELKQRNSNLIQINQTLTEALGESGAPKGSEASDWKQKFEGAQKKLQESSERASQLDSECRQLSNRNTELESLLKEEKERCASLLKTISQYKGLVRHSNQRKFQMDEKMLSLHKKLGVLRQKFQSLPIKEEYLHSIYDFIEALSSESVSDDKGDEWRGDVSAGGNRESHLRKDRRGQFYEGKNHQRSCSNIKVKGPLRNIDSGFNEFSNEGESYLFVEPNSNHLQAQFADSDMEFQSREAHSGNEFGTGAHSDLEESEVRLYEEPSSLGNDLRRRGKQQEWEWEQESAEEQNEEELFLCEVCQRVYSEPDFVAHMKECKEFESLLRQKQAIESKLVHIKEHEYQSRKSSASRVDSLSHSKFYKKNSLASQGVSEEYSVLTRAKYKGKNNRKVDDSSALSISMTHHEKPHKQKLRAKGRNSNNISHSRLELSELLNVSDISCSNNREGNRPQNCNTDSANVSAKGGSVKAGFGGKRVKGQLNEYSVVYESNVNNHNGDEEDVEMERNRDSEYASQNKENNLPRNQPSIRYRTKDMPSGNGKGRPNRAIGKESMQEEIRKIVEALNGGGSTYSRNPGSEKYREKDDVSGVDDCHSHRDSSRTERAWNRSKQGGNRTDRASVQNCYRTNMPSGSYRQESRKR